MNIDIMIDKFCVSNQYLNSCYVKKKTRFAINFEGRNYSIKKKCEKNFL